MKISKKYIAILILLLVLLLPVATAVNYPKLTGYVTDNANIIDPEYKQKISELADRINKNTTVEIAVLTVESLEGDNPENYAVNTFRQNGVGKKDNNNGLLILVSKNDRKYRFEVGYGLEGTIPDAMKVPIGDKIILPNFKNGDYGKGIYESMLVIEGLVTNNTEVLSKYGLIQSAEVSGNGNGGISPLYFMGIIVVILIILMFIMSAIRDSGEKKSSDHKPPYKPPPYTYSKRSSSGSSSTRRSSGSISHSHIGGGFGGGRSGGGGFGGFGGGRSGGGGFGGGW